MSVCFVVNPVAGKNRARNLIPYIKEKMKKTDIKYKIIETTKPKEAIEITKNALGKGFDIIVAVGGDGTINEVMIGIVEMGKGILGIIPGGTGNDLARTLNIPENVKYALDLIIDRKVKSIDLGYADGKPFLNVASIGFDAEIVKNTEKIKRYVKSKFAYTVGLLVTLISYKCKKIKVKLDDRELNEEILLIAIGNGKYYGGGMAICPNAVEDDGLSEICFIKKIPKLKLLLLFPSIFKGKHGEFKKYVQFYKSKEVKVNMCNPISLNIDGEIFDVDDEIIFTMKRKSIEVIAQ
ncbi:hypothetical protein TR13x_08760 [Caloranaerobacter sp. TR13]|nr:hypothetical protein TR13x_08760 [Caloranaerobacter sp. TR13]